MATYLIGVSKQAKIDPTVAIRPQFWRQRNIDRIFFRDSSAENRFRIRPLPNGDITLSGERLDASGFTVPADFDSRQANFIFNHIGHPVLIRARSLRQPQSATVFAALNYRAWIGDFETSERHASKLVLHDGSPARIDTDLIASSPTDLRGLTPDELARFPNWITAAPGEQGYLLSVSDGNRPILDANSTVQFLHNDSYVVTALSRTDTDNVVQTNTIQGGVLAGQIPLQVPLIDVTPIRDHIVSLRIIDSTVTSDVVDASDRIILSSEHRLIAELYDRHKAGFSNTPSGFVQGIDNYVEIEGDTFSIARFTETENDVLILELVRSG